MKQNNDLNFSALFAAAGDKNGNAFVVKYREENAVSGVRCSDYRADVCALRDRFLALCPQGTDVFLQLKDDYAFLVAVAAGLLAACRLIISKKTNVRETAGILLSEVSGAEPAASCLSLCNGARVCAALGTGSSVREEKAGFVFERSGGRAAFVPAQRLMSLLAALPKQERGTAFFHLYPLRSPAGILFSVFLPLFSGAAVCLADGAASFVSTLQAFSPETVYLPSDCVNAVYAACCRGMETQLIRVDPEAFAPQFFGGSIETLCLENRADSAAVSGFEAMGLKVCPYSFSPEAAACDLPYSPPKTPDQKRVELAVCKTLGLSEISMYDRFFRCGGDPLSAAALSARLQIPAERIYDHPFFFDLARRLRDRGTDALPLPAGFCERVLAVPQISEPLPEGGVLLTGADGFLGAHLLEALVQAGRHVFCLVRSKKKLRQALAFYGIRLPKEQATPLVGDITLSDLGLTLPARRNLSARIAAVVHTAALTQPGFPRRGYETVNIRGAVNVLGFAAFAGASAFIVSDLRAGAPESVQAGPYVWASPYLRSKYEADVMALEAMTQGRDVTLLRLGALTPRLRDGVFRMDAQTDGIPARLGAIRALSVYHPSLEVFPAAFLPVDLCAVWCAGLILRGARRKIWRLSDPAPMRIETFLQKAGLPPQHVSAVALETRFDVLSHEPALRKLRADLFFLQKNRQLPRGSGEDAFRYASQLCLPAFSLPDSYRVNCSASPVQAQQKPEVPFRETGGMPLPALDRAQFLLQKPSPHTLLRTGKNRAEELSSALKESGIRRPLFLLSPEEAFDTSLADLISRGFFPVEICSEASVQALSAVQKRLLTDPVDGIAAVGGADVMLLAKAASAELHFRKTPAGEYAQTDRILPWIAAPTGCGEIAALSKTGVLFDPENRRIETYAGHLLAPACLIPDPAFPEGCSLEELARSVFVCAMETASCPLTRGRASARRRAGNAVSLTLQALRERKAEPELLRQALRAAALCAARTPGGYFSAFSNSLRLRCGYTAEESVAAVFYPVLSALLPQLAHALVSLFGEENADPPRETEPDQALRMIEELRTLLPEAFRKPEPSQVREEDVAEIARLTQEQMAAIASPAYLSDEEACALVRRILL